MGVIKENLEVIRERMAAAAIRASRNPDSVKLVAVSKRVPVERIQEAVDAGHFLFGENYLQEAQDKIKKLGPEVTWHFIGHLQSNKAKPASELFQVVETIDRLKLAKNLEKHLAINDNILSILIQVNIGRELQKTGVLPEDAEELLQSIAEFPHLKVKGLMAMPPFLEPEAVRAYFRQMRQMVDELVVKGLLGKDGQPELSMGMSGDYEVAIEEGSTLVRVGTALFGTRQ